MSDYVNIGTSGLRVSRLGLGTFNFGHDVVGCDEATSVAIIHAYLDAGHNYIDTANIYGGSLAETYVGKALEGRRQDVVLATKAGGAYGPGPFEGGASRKALYRASKTACDACRQIMSTCIRCTSTTTTHRSRRH